MSIRFDTVTVPALDRQKDGETDRIGITLCMHCMLTRDKNGECNNQRTRILQHLHFTLEVFSRSGA